MRLVDNGRWPLSLRRSCMPFAMNLSVAENGTVQIKGETVYKVTDVIDVTIAEVRMETRSIIARPAA